MINKERLEQLVQRLRFTRQEISRVEVETTGFPGAKILPKIVTELLSLEREAKSICLDLFVESSSFAAAVLPSGKLLEIDSISAARKHIKRGLKMLKRLEEDDSNNAF